MGFGSKLISLPGLQWGCRLRHPSHSMFVHNFLLSESDIATLAESNNSAAAKAWLAAKKGVFENAHIHYEEACPLLSAPSSPLYPALKDWQTQWVFGMHSHMVR